MTIDNRTNHFTDEQVIAAAMVIDRNAFRVGEAESNAWETGRDFPSELSAAKQRIRTRKYRAKKNARAALVAAAGVAPVQPSSTVDEAATVDAREHLHAKCDCVPDLGPAHCHLCGNERGAPVPWPECSAVTPVVTVDGLQERIEDTLAYYQCRETNPKADHPSMGYHAFSEEQREFLRARKSEAAAEIVRMILAILRGGEEQ